MSDFDFTHASQWVAIDQSRNKFVHLWGGGQDYSALVCIIHGWGEHGGRYHRLAEDFARAGFRVVAFDQQGHGHSPERRGCIQSYDSLLDDIEAFLKWSAAARPVPQILFGHSMGGNLVLNYALRKKWQPAAIIASSPMIKASRPPHWLVEHAGRIVMRVAPDFRLKSVPRAEKLMSDPDEQAALRQDELFHAQLSLRLGSALLESGRWLLRHADQLATRTLLTHGTQDFLTCHIASQEFAQLAGASCQLRILEGYLHDPFRSVERQQVIREYIEFVQQVSDGESV